MILAASLLRADTAWHEDYKAGVAALEHGDASTATDLLVSAIEKRPEPSASIKTIGNSVISYFPHFYLGKALFQLERYPEAAEEFQTEERLGEISKSPALYNELLDFRQKSNEKMSGTTGTTTVDPEVLKAQRIQRFLSSGSTALYEGKYADAKDFFKKVLVIDPSNLEAQDSLRKIGMAEDAAASEKAGAKQLIRDGLTDFLGGRYSDAARKLDAGTQKDPSSAICRFFLGCSYAAQYLLAGEKDQSLSNQAEAQFRQLVMDNPSFKIQENYRSIVSPKILEIYRRATGK